MRTGLILVDIQNDYFPGGAMELVGIRQAVAKAKELLSFFHENRWPTPHIQHISSQENASFFLPDTAGVEIHNDIKPLANERVITKHCFGHR
jgi:nicotinamidase-related amidase